MSTQLRALLLAYFLTSTTFARNANDTANANAANDGDPYITCLFAPQESMVFPPGRDRADYPTNQELCSAYHVSLPGDGRASCAANRYAAHVKY